MDITWPQAREPLVVIPGNIVYKHATTLTHTNSNTASSATIWEGSLWQVTAVDGYYSASTGALAIIPGCEHDDHANGQLFAMRILTLVGL